MKSKTLFLSLSIIASLFYIPYKTQACEDAAADDGSRMTRYQTVNSVHYITRYITDILNGAEDAIPFSIQVISLIEHPEKTAFNIIVDSRERHHKLVGMNELPLDSSVLLQGTKYRSGDLATALKKMHITQMENGEIQINPPSERLWSKADIRRDDAWLQKGSSSQS